MQATLNTLGLAPPDRADAIRSLVWQSVVQVEIDHHVPAADMSVSLILGSCGDLGVCATRATATTVRRTPRLARTDTEPMIFLSLQRSGSSIVVQHGREAVLTPGDFAVYDTSSPYSLLFDGGIDATFFRIPRAVLALPDAAIRDTAAVRISSANPLAGLTSQYLARLADDPVILSGGYGAAAAIPTIELIRAALTVQLGDDGLRREPLESTLAARILADMRAHLADPELSPAAVAARHHISVRYLHRILQRESIRFGEWVRHHRLEGTRRDLVNDGRAGTPVAAVARRWGFTDAAHFSKAFRTAYGMSPRQWRATSDPAALRCQAAGNGATRASRRLSEIESRGELCTAGDAEFGVDAVQV
ncbi:helix-turn-helix domain-containing protein [Actinoplanes sp. DH11]|uniref:helix-turn-helix domain-containing protein n=1 Tax=Actinoplanes sp. DH11 TaxID=2857011 RepID=UPI001E35EEAA|nr:helix-turn-helix domain-containing protein [Actinoplanes sp. DH11]